MAATTSKSFGSRLFEYETPKVIKLQNLKFGIFSRLFKIFVISFIVIFKLWYVRGYQEFAKAEFSVTAKVKGFST